MKLPFLVFEATLARERGEVSYLGMPVGRARVYYSEVAYDLGEASGAAALQKLQFKQVEALSSVVPAAALGEVMRSRVLWSWFAENALQLNLQTTLFALTKQASKEAGRAHAGQLQALLSITVGLLTSLLKLAEAWDFFKLASPILERVL